MLPAEELNQLKYKRQFLKVKLISEYVIEVPNDVSEDDAFDFFMNGSYDDLEIIRTGNSWIHSMNLESSYASFGSEENLNKDYTAPL